MLRARTLYGTALVVVILLGGCTVSQQGASKAVTLSENESGRTVQLNRGDTLDVVLTANATTGYTWEQTESDSAILKPVGDPEFKSASSALGAGGKMTFHFQAAASGQTALKLIYHRTFEKNVPPLQTYQVTVAVK